MTTTKTNYPAQPWPLDNLMHHPAFIAGRKRMSDMNNPDDDNQLTRGILRVIDGYKKNPALYESGIPYMDFLDFHATGKMGEAVLEELERMNVMTLDSSSGRPIVRPCSKIALERTKCKYFNYYLPVEVGELIKNEAWKRRLSAGKLVALAVTALTGDPMPTDTGPTPV